MTTYEYWRNRERERRRREEQILNEAERFAEIEAIYEGMYDWADREINAFYGKYADAEGIDIAEAKKRVSNLDIEAYEKMAEQYVKDKDFSKEANEAMRLYNATMKINRLELLKAQIGLHMVDGFDQIDKLMGEYLTDEAVAEYERQAGILGTTLTEADTLERAHNIVDASFYNATYSERIWSHQDNLRDAIATELQKGLIAGNSSRQMARRIKDQFGVSQDDAFRLMVTEFRRVQTDVAMDSYKSQDIEKYMYMAVNPNACPICRELNNKVYDVEGAEIGNPDHPLPPMHPRCHCTTAPYLDEQAYEDWLTWIENGGTTEQWSQMSPEERQRFRQSVVQSPQGEAEQADTFTPAKTKAEAEEYAGEFTDKNRFGAVGVSYDGVDLEIANTCNKTIGDFFKKYRVEKFGGILAPKGNTKLGKLMSNATAGYSPVRHSFLLNRKSLKDMETAQKNFQAERDAITDILEHPEKYDLSKGSRQLQRVVENSRQSGRSTYPATLEEALWHECGHALDRQMRKMPGYSELESRMMNYAPNISGYACDSMDEYIAESFSAYNAGDYDILDPMMIEAFRKCER